MSLVPDSSVRSIAVGVLLAVHGGVGQAQQSATIRYAPKCATCRIVREKVVSFGAPNDPVLISPTVEVARDSRGRHFATGYPGTSVIVFDSAGRYLTAFGQRGQGPGEFQAALAGILIGPGDTVYVFDVWRRLYVFSPTLKYVRSAMLPARFIRSGAILGEGRILLSASVATPENAGFPMHIIATDGRVLRSFGTASPELRPGQGPSGLFALRHDKSGVWITDSKTYHLTFWDVEGRKQKILSVENVPWMPGTQTGSSARSGTSTPTRVATARAAYEDSAGRLWVQGFIDDPKWKDNPAARAARDDFTMLSRSLDNFVDVYDTKSMTHLVSARFDEYFWPLGDTDLVYSCREDEDGVITIDVWRMRVAKGSS